MASRDLLHKAKLPAFIEWCSRNHIETRPGRGAYQLLQVYYAGLWSVIYERNHMPEHVTIPQSLIGVVHKFIHNTRSTI